MGQAVREAPEPHDGGKQRDRENCRVMSPAASGCRNASYYTSRLMVRDRSKRAPFRFLSPRAVVTAIGALAILAVSLIYGFHLAAKPIRSDGIGHYLYLPAAFIDHDL